MKNCKNCIWCIKLIESYMCMHTMNKFKHPRLRGGKKCGFYQHTKKSKFTYPTCKEK